MAQWNQHSHKDENVAKQWAQVLRHSVGAQGFCDHADLVRRHDVDEGGDNHVEHRVARNQD